MQSQLYTDNPIWIFRGPTSRRKRNLALLLYTARALGVNMAWRKGSKGSNWCGLEFASNAGGAEEDFGILAWKGDGEP